MTKIQYLKDNLNVLENEIIIYGSDKFKIDLKINQRLVNQKPGQLILVSAINPTSSGEGKTTVSIGLAQGFKKLGKNVMLALREPSMGPVFGMKGGATGGGMSELEPALDINMHFNGDLHAITAANNLLSALIDNHIYFGNKLKFKTIYWQRALDCNDRSLRTVVTTQREDKFNITAASEMMAILALAKDFKDLKDRLNSILIGVDEDGKDLFVKDLECMDSLAMILKDAIKPNLVFAKEMVPALVHAGPFANIAHGCNSVIATNTALRLSDYVITEAGFGADLGMEKFLHIKQPHLIQQVGVVVLVATIKALKLHGGVDESNLDEMNIEALKKGLTNLEKHIENVKKFGLNAVVAINKFPNDLDSEIDILYEWAHQMLVPIGLSEGFMKGGDGTKELAKLVIDTLSKKSHFKPLYDNNIPHQEKITQIAKELYGANAVELSKKAINKLKQYKDFNYPVCIAKTPLSLSGNPLLKGRPSDFILEISDVKISNGAKQIVCLTKGINTMPGLNEHPRALDFKINDEGELIS
ncbi:Formate--tetrahydrofolate ligase [Acholeplasma oculi]|uniref:Formate--tetrahydrofolate ligase n=1 Tax=Acholeplasma oculi TaxID=35623 RepID=A0A061AKC3_9MOLU|nr:formate--tetrahydrofolate ligase [Acholeplasma oculi]CDR31487.1 Formate--tetrahydrofolate ligase [Acholeplasma oculi]SKC49309.1 Formate-tetrahydrofolate ligase [Acholeplasma oculi]SUT92224.1 Formate--tetrahydrofolate ligase [Acholeplasma oculi]